MAQLPYVTPIPAGVLRDLARHLEWADACVWRAVLRLQPAALDARVAFWLHHIHTVEHVFTRLWRGEPLALPELGAFPEPAGLARWGWEASRRLQAFLDEASADELERALAVPWSAHVESLLGRPASAITVGESALQVAIHSTHHRGQVLVRLRELGGEPPLVDYIAWLWLGRPAGEWPQAGGDR